MISFSSWSVLTVDFLIILHLSLAGVMLSALLHLVGAKWRFDIRVISVSFFSLYPLAFILLLILLYGGKLTFPWVGGYGKLPAWNNLPFLATREILGFIIVGLVYGSFVRLQAKAESNPDASHNFRWVAGVIPFVHVLFCTMVAWDFEMTLLPSWESSMYSIYHFVSVFGMYLGVLVITVYFLDKAGLFIKSPGSYLYNYIAQMMLGFSILWVYTFFGQYLIIWYANFGDETDRIFLMQNGPYGGLFWTFFVMKFVFPFVMLVFPFNRKNPSAIALIASSIVIGTWIERYTWISGTYPTHHMPMTGMFDLGSTIIVFGIAYLIMRRAFKRNHLIR